MNSHFWHFWRCLSVAIHLIAVSLFGFALVFQFMYPFGYYQKQSNNEMQTLNSTKHPDTTFGWKYKTLTFINMNLQFLIFILHLICDCFKANYLPTKAIESNLLKHLFRIRDTLFHSIILPIGLFVSISYWTLFAINKEYVVNMSSESLNPWWLTHVGHSIIVPIVLLEVITSYHRRSRLVIDLSILVTLITGYIVWIYYLALFHEIWVYGILRKSSTVYRIVILIGFTIFCIVLYFIGLLLHKLFWPKRRVELWPQQWSADEISIDQLEFESFRVRQELIT